MRWRKTSQKEHVPYPKTEPEAEVAAARWAENPIARSD
jgi:hypothetical protein